MKILTALGQYQYGDPSRGESLEFASFLPALRRLGHEVHHFESWNRGRFGSLAELNRGLLQETIRFEPDLLFVVPYTNELWLETIRLINELGVTTVCWTTDDSWKYDEHSRFYGTAFQAMTTTYESVLKKYRRDGIANVLLTQWGARTETLLPPIAAAECRYGVTFIGAAHGNRRRIVEQLRRKGLLVECFGHGWPAGSIPAEEIPRIMRQSVISLNFANSRGLNQIKARTFEVPGGGGFLLTDQAPGLERYYRIGEEIVCFDNITDLIRKAKHYLTHPTERDRIAHGGFRRTKADHTYEMRMRGVVDFSLSCRQPASETAPEAILKRFEHATKQHTRRVPLRFALAGMTGACRLMCGNQRGRRLARRIVHEISWRVWGANAYMAGGLTGRCFPDN